MGFTDIYIYIYTTAEDTHYLKENVDKSVKH